MLSEAIKVQRRQHQKKRRCDKDHLALHPVTVKVKAVCTNVLPCQKAKAAKDDQGRDYCGKQWVTCIPCQRNKFCTLCSQQVKTCIAERRNGMKQCIPNPAQAIIGAKCRQQQCSTGQFKQSGDPQNKACQPHDAAHLWGSGGFLHRAALLEGDLSPRKQRKGSAHCNDTQSSDLDQKKDHTLPKSPMQKPSAYQSRTK